MALFKKKTEQKTLSSQTGEAPVKKEKAVPESKSEDKSKSKLSAKTVVFSAPKDSSTVLKAPRITEKATFAAENGVYVFEIDLRATKRDVALAVESLYKVKPVKVNIVKIPSKSVQSRRRGLFGTTAKGKKAYVYLKKGDTIEIV